MRELEHARQRADDFDQLSASVKAISEKAKVAGLMTEKIEIKQADFDDDMSVEEILQEVAAEAGTKAAIALCEAFGNRSEDFDLSGGGGKHPEIRDVSAPQPGYSQFASEETRPVKDRKREL